MNPLTRLLIIALTLAQSYGATATLTPPNILFIFLDDYGWRDAGFMGSDFYETPHLDRLAAEGMIFTNAYSASANCAPARASLLSGQYTPRHRIYNVGTEPRGKAAHRRLGHVPGVDVLDPTITTWAARAQQAGYTTATMGKWHLSDDPIPYGFDINIGGTHSGSPPKGYYPPHNVPGLTDAPDDEYLTDRLSQEAVNFIESHTEKPWLLYLTHFAVHTPLDAKRELLPKYEAKPPGQLHHHVPMATMIEAVDTGVGKILATLDRLNLASHTIVILTSDNGGYGPATDMAPLKGYKGTYYEGGIRVPFAVKWPGVTKAGSRSDGIVTNVDIYPTLCEMMGLTKTPHQIQDGISLAPLLRGASPDENRAVFWHFPAYLQAYAQVADEQRDPLFRSRPVSVIRQGDWKLHHYYEDDAYELYNLREDIGETHNRFTEAPQEARRLQKILANWIVQTHADIPPASNPEFDAVVHEQALQAARLRRN